MIQISTYLCYLCYLYVIPVSFPLITNSPGPTFKTAASRCEPRSDPRNVGRLARRRPSAATGAKTGAGEEELCLKVGDVLQHVYMI